MSRTKESKPGNKPGSKLPMEEGIADEYEDLSYRQTSPDDTNKSKNARRKKKLAEREKSDQTSAAAAASTIFPPPRDKDAQLGKKATDKQPAITNLEATQPKGSKPTDAQVAGGKPAVTEPSVPLVAATTDVQKEISKTKKKKIPDTIGDFAMQKPAHQLKRKQDEVVSDSADNCKISGQEYTNEKDIGDVGKQANKAKGKARIKTKRTETQAKAAANVPEPTTGADVVVGEEDDLLLSFDTPKKVDTVANNEEDDLKASKDVEEHRLRSECSMAPEPFQGLNVDEKNAPEAPTHTADWSTIAPASSNESRSKDDGKDREIRNAMAKEYELAWAAGKIALAGAASTKASDHPYEPQYHFPASPTSDVPMASSTPPTKAVSKPKASRSERRQLRGFKLTLPACREDWIDR